MTNNSSWGLMCDICFRDIPIDECHVDEQGQKWDVCAGQCAILSGMVPAEHQAEHDEILARNRATDEGVLREYYAFVDRICP